MSRSSIASFKLILSCGIASAFWVSGQPLPHHAAEVELDFTPRTSEAFWVNGFLVQYTRDIGGALPTISLRDRNGKFLIPQTELNPPNLRRFSIKAVTADLAGNAYAGAEAWADDKAATGVILRVNRDRSPIIVIRTDDFLPVSLAVSRSGDVWTFGHPLLLQTSRSTTEEYNTLLRFKSATGQLLESFLPRREFGETIIPTQSFGDIGVPQMWATANRIGVYSAVAHRWVEFDSITGKKLIDLFVPPPEIGGAPATSLRVVMTDSDNAVYAWFWNFRPGPPHQAGVYQLDKGSQRWVPVRNGTASSEFGLLTGGDGDDLVIRTGSKSFGWFRSGDIR